MFKGPGIKKDGEINFSVLTALELKEQLNELLKSFELEETWSKLLKRHIITNWKQDPEEEATIYLKRIYPRVQKIVRAMEEIKNKTGGTEALRMMAKNQGVSIKEKMDMLEGNDIEDILTSYGPF